MAESVIPEALRRPPFANYDIVVYFGAGLFSVPFLNRYLIRPLKAVWPNFSIDVSSEIARQAVSLLSLLFSIYILGHIIAWISSQVVEKVIDRFLGKTSTAILISATSLPQERDRLIRDSIQARLALIKDQKMVFGTICRTAIHAPVIVFYWIIYKVGIFPYFDTRVSAGIIDSAQRRLPEIPVTGLNISPTTKWYKPLEYFVINRRPEAVSRMYNYLVISGLFRSLSLIFLFSLWSVIGYMIHWLIDGDWLLDSLFGETFRGQGLVEFTLMSALYLFSVFAYLKFQRRYAEEAIFAFVFSE